MGGLAWVMMGIALWHFTVFLPDRFWAGIVGAFLGALVGSVLFGWVINGFSIPGREETDIMTPLEAVPGAILGLGVVWLLGVRQERSDAFGRTSTN